MDKLLKIWIEGESFHVTQKQLDEMNHFAHDVPKTDPTWGQRRAAVWLSDNDIESDQTGKASPEEILKLKEQALEQTERTMKLQKAEVEKARKRLKPGNATTVLLLLGASSLLLDYLFPLEGSFHMATLIGALITGAGVVTTFSGRAACDQCILIGDADTAVPLSGLQVDIDGDPVINITGSAPLVVAFFKLMKMMTAATVGVTAFIATGKNGKNATYKFINAGATTPNIFAFSMAREGVPVRAAVKGINANDWQEFDKFSFLQITPSANVGSIDIEYEDGHREPGLSVLEVDAMFMLTDNSEANGRLDPVVTTIDNRPYLGNQIKKVRVNATTAVSVSVIKLDDQDYKRLTA